MKHSAQVVTEDQQWAAVVLRVWAECSALHREFDSICDFEFWVHEVSENLIRSADVAGEK
jgi:hypothetical protein